ncbi:MAG: hypothetical protein R3C40_07005 [Parvularculaceae bacterium]
MSRLMFMAVCGFTIFSIPAGDDVPDPEENEKFAHKLQFLGKLREMFKSPQAAKKANYWSAILTSRAP